MPSMVMACGLCIWSPKEARRWPWVTPVRGRLQVPSADGVGLSELGFSGRSLQGGRKKLQTSEFSAAVRYLVR